MITETEQFVMCDPKGIPIWNLSRGGMYDTRAEAIMSARAYDRMWRQIAKLQREKPWEPMLRRFSCTARVRVSTDAIERVE